LVDSFEDSYYLLGELHVTAQQTHRIQDPTAGLRENS